MPRLDIDKKCREGNEIQLSLSHPTKKQNEGVSNGARTMLDPWRSLHKP